MVFEIDQSSIEQKPKIILRRKNQQINHHLRPINLFKEEI